MESPRAKAPTIHDIAAEARVSKSAVSRALRGQGQVSPEARKRIEIAAKKLGYVANAMARGMRSRTMTLGVLLRDIKRPYYAWLQDAMQQEAERQGYHIVTMSNSGDMAVPDALRALESLVSLQVDGLVIASARLPSEEIVPYVDRVPIVVAGRRETSKGITSVFCDDTDGGRTLAEHLLRLGHRRIAVLLVDKSYSLSQHSRGLAMIDTIRAAGATATTWETPSDQVAGQVFAARLGQEDVSAIMCPTDAALMDVLEVLRCLSYSAPDDFALTGYDGFGPLAAPYLGLTTYRQPIEEIGRTSIRLLIDRVEDRTIDDVLIAFQGSLVEGRTADRVHLGESARVVKES